ncbi:MAG: exonuclease domain-containing protein [Ignavibacteria bacterium]|nr:exonuclease domain-containing protein [Ignavibacteria bacterium]
MTTSKTYIQDCNFIVCDVETTGLSPYIDRIIEISLIKVKNSEIVDNFTTLINPKKHIPSFITSMTGIANEDVINKPSFEDINDDIYNYIFDDEIPPIFSGHNVLFDYKFVRESFRRTNPSYNFNLNTLCTCKLARRLLRKLKSKSLSNLARYFGIKQLRKHRSYSDAITTTKILLKFLDILQDEFEYEYIEDIIKFQNSRIYTKENKSPALKRVNIDLKKIPEEPGVYFMKNKSGEILYIGKAKNLKDRISSYFHHHTQISPKIRKLLSSVYSVEYELTNSELSALILESKLIKKHKPKYNTAIKRYIYHPFLKINYQYNFPTIESVYEIENDSAYYYGPFTSKSTITLLLKDIQNNFKLRKCERKEIKPSEENSNCFYYDIDKCYAPCKKYISQEDYLKEVEKVHNYLTGTDVNSIQFKLRLQMENFSNKLDFEKAAIIRDKLKDILKVMNNHKVITSAINDKKVIIKCDNKTKREIFFIHNGKLIKTFLLNGQNEINQTDILNDILEETEYLFFSLNKYTKHKFSQEELDEIKVVSNWLAINYENTSYLEIDDETTPEKIMKFINS